MLLTAKAQPSPGTPAQAGLHRRHRRCFGGRGGKQALSDRAWTHHSHSSDSRFTGWVGPPWACSPRLSGQQQLTRDKVTPGPASQDDEGVRPDLAQATSGPCLTAVNS